MHRTKQNTTGLRSERERLESMTQSKGTFYKLWNTIIQSWQYCMLVIWCQLQTYLVTVTVMICISIRVLGVLKNFHSQVNPHRKVLRTQESCSQAFPRNGTRPYAFLDNECEQSPNVAKVHHLEAVRHLILPRWASI